MLIFYLIIINNINKYKFNWSLSNLLTVRLNIFLSFSGKLEILICLSYTNLCIIFLFIY